MLRKTTSDDFLHNAIVRRLRLTWIGHFYFHFSHLTVAIIALQTRSQRYMANIAQFPFDLLTHNPLYITCLFDSICIIIMFKSSQLLVYSFVSIKKDIRTYCLYVMQCLHKCSVVYCITDAYHNVQNI